MMAFGCARLSAESAAVLSAGEMALADGQPTGRRRSEILAGRLAARRAMTRLGVRPRPVLHRGGVPDFGAGLVGSLSHSGDLALAVAGRSDGLAGVGVDVESAGFLPAGAARLLCRGDELADAPPVGTDARRRWLVALFSAKESLYKAVSHSTGSWLHPHDVRCVPRAFGFSARWRRALSPELRSGAEVPVYVLWFPGGVATFVALPGGPGTRCGAPVADPRDALRAVLGAAVRGGGSDGR